MTASAVATARCLVHPSYQIPAILRTILRDEFFDFQDKKQEHSVNASQSQIFKNQKIIVKVTQAVTDITTRLNSLAYFDGNDSKVRTLLAAANSPDNLCRMDPSWYPWL